MVVVAVRVVGEVVRQVITCLPGSPRHHCSRGDEPAGQQQPHIGRGQHLRLLAQGPIWQLPGIRRDDGCPSHDAQQMTLVRIFGLCLRFSQGWQ
jgi:hypothetical protein